MMLRELTVTVGQAHLNAGRETACFELKHRPRQNDGPPADATLTNNRLFVLLLADHSPRLSGGLWSTASKCVAYGNPSAREPI